MKFISHDNINFSSWDDCIAESDSGLIYALSWWLDSVCHWDALVKINDSGYSWVFPIPTKSKGGIKYVYPPFFIQQLGLFGNFSNEDEKKVFEFLQANYKFVEYFTNYDNNFPLTEVKKNLILPLSLGASDLSKQFSTNHKRNIKKASSFKLEIKPLDSTEEVIQLFRLNRGEEVKHWGDIEYNQFLSLSKQANSKGMLKVFGVYFNSTLVCGASFFEFNKRIIFLFSGMNEQGKKTNALFFLLSEIIKSFCDQDIVLDFEGSGNEGLYRFYKGFGAKEQNCSFLKINNLPFYLKWLKK